MIRAVVGSKKADEQVVVALGGDGKGEGLGQSLAEIQASRPGSGRTFKAVFSFTVFAGNCFGRQTR